MSIKEKHAGIQSAHEKTEKLGVLDKRLFYINMKKRKVFLAFFLKNFNTLDYSLKIK
jgi:hypothetical protein